MFPQKITLWLYPLGLFANLFFGTAFCVQWFLTKKKGSSFVPKIFWHLSSTGAVLMICHGFIQSQYPIALLHSFNLIIYFRNLNITSSNPLPVSKIASLLVATATAITLSFAIGTYYLPHMTWMASPNILHLDLPEANFSWQMIGCIGLTIFSLRFFIQWFYLEYRNHTSLPGGPAYWGDLFALFTFYEPEIWSTFCAMDVDYFLLWQIFALPVENLFTNLLATAASSLQGNIAVIL